MSTTRLLAGLSTLATSYDVFLCDVWGVIHDGLRAFPAATDALTRVRAGGATVILLTNAARPHGPVIAQLDGIGVPRSAYDAVVTSGDATAALIGARGDATAFHIGPAKDHSSLFDEVAAATGVAPVLGTLDESRYVVCTGLFDDSTETPEDYRGMLAAMRARNLDLICANPDIVVHIGDRLIPCAGAIAQRYAALGGTVLYAGKPHPPIYDAAMAVAARCRGGSVDRSRVLAVGDGLRTDIAGARGQGFDSLFVTAGIHREETLMPGTGAVDPVAVQALLDEAGERPVAALPHLAW